MITIAELRSECLTKGNMATHLKQKLFSSEMNNKDLAEMITKLKEKMMGKDDWIEARSSLGKEAWKLRYQRSHNTPVSKAGDHDNDGIWRPNSSPQANVGNGHLCNAEFSAL